MTREEILEKSRKENVGKDERERHVNTRSSDIAGRISLAIAILISMFIENSGGPRIVHCIVWLIVGIYKATFYAYKAYQLKKQSYWFFVAGYSIFSLVDVYLLLGFLT